MSLDLHINAEKLFKEMEKHLDEIGRQKKPVIVRQALNRTLRDVNVKVGRDIRKKLRLKLKDIKRKQMITTRKASGNRVHEMRATISLSGKSISLINFINNPQPVRQAYVPVKKRKPVIVKVGSKRTVLKTAFIQKGKKNASGEGNIHVFKRIRSKTYWKKQSAPSLAAIFQQDNYEQTIQRHSRDVFDKNFKQLMNYELSKIKDTRV